MHHQNRPQFLNIRSNPTKGSKADLSSNMSASHYLQTSSTKSSCEESQHDNPKRLQTQGQDFLSGLIATNDLKAHRLTVREKRPTTNASFNSLGNLDVNENNELARRSSILSQYNVLSIQSDCYSVVDSTASVYAPSINEPVVCENASPEELLMHEFLNNAGIFQINVKDQLQTEKKSQFSSPKLNAQFMTKKSSPTFLQKRAQRLAEKGKQASVGSFEPAKGIQSHKAFAPRLSITTKSFTNDIFAKSAQKPGQTNHIYNRSSNQLYKSVQEEPNSANSVNKLEDDSNKGPDESQSTLVKVQEVEAGSNIQNQPFIHLGAALPHSDSSNQDDSMTCDQLKEMVKMNHRHMSLTPQTSAGKLYDKPDTINMHKRHQLSTFSNRDEDQSKSSSQSFTITLNATSDLQNDNDNINERNLQVMIDSKSHGDSIKVKAFNQLFQHGDLSKGSVESSSPEGKHSASSFSARGMFDHMEKSNGRDKIDEENSDSETPTMPKRRDTDISIDQIMGLSPNEFADLDKSIGQQDEEMKTPDQTMNMELDCSTIYVPNNNLVNTSDRVRQGKSPLSGAMMSPNLSQEHECGLQISQLPDETPPDTPIFKIERPHSLNIGAIAETAEENNTHMQHDEQVHGYMRQSYKF